MAKFLESIKVSIKEDVQVDGVVEKEEGMNFRFRFINRIFVKLLKERINGFMEIYFEALQYCINAETSNCRI